jgi:hypothetical protein
MFLPVEIMVEKAAKVMNTQHLQLLKHHQLRKQHRQHALDANVQIRVAYLVVLVNHVVIMGAVDLAGHATRATHAAAEHVQQILLVAMAKNVEVMPAEILAVFAILVTHVVFLEHA